MPSLSEVQRTAIRSALGYPTRFFQTHALSTRLEQAMNAIDNMTSSGDATSYDVVAASLSNISTLQADLVAAKPLLKVAKVGKIDLQVIPQMATLRSEGRRAVGALAAFLGVPVIHDVFSSSLPREPGDNEVVLG